MKRGHIISSYGHKMHDHLEPLSSVGRTVVAKIFKAIKDNHAPFLYDWVSVESLVPHVKKIAPYHKGWTLSVCYFNGSLMFRFSRTTPSFIKHVYVSQRDFRHLNFSIKKLQDAKN